MIQARPPELANGCARGIVAWEVRVRKTLLPAGVEPYLTHSCPRCERPLRVTASPGRRASRCPGCGFSLGTSETVAAPPLAAPAPSVPQTAPPTLARPKGWAGQGLVLAPALLAPGLLLLTRGLPAVGLAGGVLLACVALSLWQRWRPAVRFLLALALTGLGYAAAFAYFVPGADKPAADPPSEAPANRDLLYGPVPAGGPALPSRPFPGAPMSRQPDLQYQTTLGDLLAVAIDPEAGTAFVTRANGRLDQYSYPEFRRQGSYQLDRPGYRAALDGRRGRLYVAVSDPDALRANRQADRPAGNGDLHVYDIRGQLQGRTATAALRPAAVLPLGGNVSHLLLAPDHSCLYYLLHGPDGDTVGRLSTAPAGGETRQPLPGAAALCLSPDGKGLYAADPGRVVNLDPVTLRVRQTFAIDLAVNDLAADNGGRVFVAEQGQATSITVLDARHDGSVLARIRPQLHGRIYLQLASDGARLYVGSSSLLTNTLRSLAVAEGTLANPTQLAQVVTDRLGTVRGEFFLAPNGKHLVSRWGIVLRLAELEHARPPAPVVPPRQPEGGGQRPGRSAS